MDKLKMHSPDLSQANIEKVQSLFPNCVTEVEGENGEIKLAVDFDLLKQELSDSIVEGPQERYQLNWPGKREALLTANAPIAKTLRPCRDESINFNSTENLFIEGDNLDALKLLQETYLGKVKLIYIDPPYNTGKDFIYPDNFTDDLDDFLLKSNQVDENENKLIVNQESNGRFHSDWMSMMYSRLKLARNLMRDDGSIFISIDDGEVANLRKLADEIFGEANFVANIIWHKRYAASNDAKGIPAMHDHILIYQKSNSFNRKLLPRTDKQNSKYKYDSQDGKGRWRPDNLTVKTVSEAYIYDIVNPNTGKAYQPTQGRCWLTNKEKMQEWIHEGRVFFGQKGDGAPQLKRYLSEVQDGVIPNSYWSYEEVGHTDSSRKELKKIFETSAPFDNPKPTGLLKRIFQITLDENDIVLDFFAGSGTTADALMQYNIETNSENKFVVVQIPEDCDAKSNAFKAGFETISEITKERIRRTIKILSKDNKDVNDLGFRVLKVDNSNMTDVYYRPDQANQADMFAQVQNIKEDRSDEDLLFQVLLDWGVGLTLPISKQQISSKDVFFVNADETGEGADLIACFASDISNELIKAIAEKQPLRVVFKDDGFATDAVKINVEQIFKQISPITDVKSI